KKLHTARSRNDQVAVDTRLWFKAEVAEIFDLLKALQQEIIALAKQHDKTIMPGYTHLQRAQPISFAHHLLAYFNMFARDLERLADCRRRADFSPLGSCALAGTTLPINREQTAKDLGFSGYTANSLDGVSDRDFAIEFCADASIIMMHLSRFCEEIILWSSSEFAFVSLDDAYSTGSSIMPQKKNPDVAELVRGKTGRVYGALITLLTVMKSLPLAYNKDMQEDKEPLFDAVDTVKGCLTVFTPMLASLKINKDKMRAAVGSGFLNATDLADYLAAKGLPFREAHAVSGRLVLYCEQKGKALDDLSLDELKQASELFEQDIYQAISVDTCLAARTSAGGPAPEAVKKAIKEAEAKLAKLSL
ncbi:MAG: argininosuccinate lyase, partial [Clostridia bacterium]|nr:argininosuccinate lyase [Clostridia bacterium]